MKRLLVALSLAVGFAAAPAHAQEGEGAESQDLAQEAANPVSSIRALALQSNIDFGIGQYDRTMYRLNIQPWRASLGRRGWLRVRSFSALPILYRPDVSSAEGGTFGLGDPNISAFWSPDKARGFVLGIGPVLSIPLATDPTLGTGKWSAGVSLFAVAAPKQWLFGLRIYNLWSFAGSSDRPSVNQFLLQYYLLLRLGRGWYLVSSPVITADWNLDSGDRWLAPFGGGGGKIIKLGRRGIDLQLQAFFYAVHPETLPYPDWTLRVQFQFLFVR